MATRIEYSKRERNIPLQIWESWKAMKKPEDARELAKYCRRSLPVIYAALNNGYASKPALVQKISDYYLKRPAEVVEVSNKDQALIEKAKKQAEQETNRPAPTQE